MQELIKANRTLKSQSASVVNLMAYDGNGNPVAKNPAGVVNVAANTVVAESFRPPVVDRSTQMSPQRTRRTQFSDDVETSAAVPTAKPPKGAAKGAPAPRPVQNKSKMTIVENGAPDVTPTEAPVSTAGSDTALPPIGGKGRRGKAVSRSVSRSVSRRASPEPAEKDADAPGSAADLLGGGDLMSRLSDLAAGGKSEAADDATAAAPAEVVDGDMLSDLATTHGEFSRLDKVQLQDRVIKLSEELVRLTEQAQQWRTRAKKQSQNVLSLQHESANLHVAMRHVLNSNITLKF